MVSLTLRSSVIRSCAMLLLALPFACGDDDGEASENESVVADNGSATQGDSESATSTTVSTASATGPTSGSGSGSGPTSTATEATAADSTTGPDIPVVCTEELTCNPGEVCVLPCCGGPQPGCFEAPEGGECSPPDTPDVGGVRCCQNDPDPAACMMLQWCIPGPCMADPPHCVTPDLLDCNGSSCSTDGCYGELVAGQLQCSCK